jgi:hypothetical protein
MPVLLKLGKQNQSSQFAGFVASDRMHYGDSTPEHGRIHYFEDDVLSRNEWAVPWMNFAAPWRANLPASPDCYQKTGLSRDNLSAMHSATLQGDGWIGAHAIPGLQKKHDERSHRSSEDTPLNVEDLPHNDPSAEDDEASQSTEAADAEVKIYEEYLASGEDLGQESKGITIILRDIPYKMEVETHVFDLLQSTSDLSQVDYIYLPMTNNTDAARNPSRNKGYCFIHFSDYASAQLFASRLEQYVLPGSLFPSAKTMIAGLAKFQGLSLNLHNLLDVRSKKWRPKNGHAYIRCAGGELTRCRLQQLRGLLKRRSVAHGKKRRFTS